MRKWIGIAIVVLLGAGGIVALFSNGRASEGSAEGAKASGSATAADSAAGRSAFATGRSDGAQPAGGTASVVGAPPGGTVASKVDSTPVPVGAAVPKVDSRVVKHATLDVTVRRDRLKSVFGSANGIAGFLGGFVASSDESRGSATVTLRVPADRFEDAMKQLSGLGRVTNRSERGDDVSAKFSDLDARLRNLSAQEGVLQDLMRQAKNIPDTITVQQQLSAVREQIEQLTGERNLLDDQASYGTITVTMQARGVAPAPSAGSRGTVAQAWHDAVGVTLAIFAGTIVVLGAVVPLALLGLIGFGGWILIRRRRRTAGVSPAGI